MRIGNLTCTGHRLIHLGDLVIRRRSRAPVFLATVVTAIDQHALADRLIHSAMGASHHLLGLARRPLATL